LLSSSNVRANSRSPTLAALALAVAVAGAGLTGCPGSLDPSLTGTGTGGSGGGGGTSGVCDAPMMVFQSTDLQQGCGSNAACHGATAKESGLDLVSAGVVARLLDKAPDPAMSVSCPNSTMPYLISNTNPAQGLMIDKLSNPPTCGAPMPYPAGGLSSTQKTCLLQWATAVTTGMITQ
jgi:hypothetical protein